MHTYIYMHACNITYMYSFIRTCIHVDTGTKDNIPAMAINKYINTYIHTYIHTLEVYVYYCGEPALLK